MFRRLFRAALPPKTNGTSLQAPEPYEHPLFTRVHALPEVPVDLADQLRSYSQGDILTDIQSIIVGLESNLLSVECPYGVVLISQTCDVVQVNRASVQVAAVTVLTGHTAKEAWARKRPRFVPIPALGLRETQSGTEATFADLELVGTLLKRQLVGSSRTKGVTSDADARNFGRDVARRYGRFPFPDEVTPWLIPLETILQSKHAKPGSPEGQLLKLVDSLRVCSATGWQKPPYALTLEVILQPEALPSFDDEPEIPNEFVHWFEDPRKLPASGAIAEMILTERQRPRGEQQLVHIYWLWMAIAQAWAARCRLKKPDSYSSETRSALVDGKIDADIASTDTYSLMQYKKSVELDLDHLSPPPPQTPER